MTAGSALVAAAAALALVAPATDTPPERHADIPARSADLVYRVETLDGAQRTIDGPGQKVLQVQARVLFAKDSADLSLAARAALDQVAVQIAEAAPTGTVLVNGFTDDLGSAAHGLTLSRQRAEAVMEVLERDERLSGVTFRARGYGEARPRADNGSETGRERNRRVELVLPT